MSDVERNQSNTTVEWQFVSDNEIKHLSGFVLVLTEGSWRDPMDIRPRVAGNQSAIEVSQLIRKGLAFAGSAARPQSNFSSAPSQPRKTPSRPVLSLKKSRPTKKLETV